jgi:hypothetical protein
VISRVVLIVNQKFVVFVVTQVFVDRVFAHLTKAMQFHFCVFAVWVFIDDNLEICSSVKNGQLKEEASSYHLLHRGERSSLSGPPFPEICPSVPWLCGNEP